MSANTFSGQALQMDQEELETNRHRPRLNVSRKNRKQPEALTPDLTGLKFSTTQKEQAGSRTRKLKKRRRALRGNGKEFE